MMFKDVYPEVSGPGKMDDNWWARFGLEEAAMDRGETGDMPAHDRLARLLDGKDPRIPIREAAMGSFAIYRTPEQGHTRKCLAKAMIVAIENLRDVDNHMGPEWQGSLDHDFRIQVQDGIPLQWADMYLAEGMTECLCEPIEIDREAEREEASRNLHW